MAERPLLLFPQAVKQLPAKGRGFPLSLVNKPGVARQKERLGPAFQKLEDAFEAKRAELSVSASGMEPEKVLVIETADAVDFQRAVRSIAGLEWLGEFELDDVEPDYFHYESNPSKPVPHVLYLAMTNQRAIEEIVSLWNLWKSDEQKFSEGRTKWRYLFSLCRTIRYWNTDDRLNETGLIDALQDILADAPQSVSMEIEFWHRSEARLRASKERVLNLLREADGEVVADAHIDEIGYSAIKASIPAELAGRIVGGHRPGFFNEDAVYCLRPEGQCVTSIPDSVESASVPDRPLPTEPPVVAILDGVPFQRHQYLVDRIELDDPDNFAGAYQAGEQKHGTAMVSLVIHGELNDVDASALNSKVYVRPVTAPDRTHVMPNQTAAEIIPSKELIVDFIHRAVKEIFERNDGKDFSTVKVVNVSLGDLSRPFSRTASPWARLLDWLSWKYQVLFCVSTGNYGDDIDLGIAPQNFAKLNDDDKSQKTLAAMAESLPNRRLLSPAESMNAITVGALHHDFAGQYPQTHRVDIQPKRYLPSPITRLGSGFRNSIKPDIVMPGGRQFYEDVPGRATYRISQGGLSPGQYVAAPPPAGTAHIDHAVYMRGTSNATALASRGAARIHEALREIQSENSGAIPDANLAVLMKALLVHGATWGDAQYHLEILKQYAGPRNFKRYLSRFMGYGAVDIERVIECTALRATVIGTASIGAGEELEYRFPLPPALSGWETHKRLIITLAWFTPINPAHQNWRQAKLFYTPPKENGYIDLSRKEADWRHVKKGTVQHEVLQGKEAYAYQDGDHLKIPVVCKTDAGDFDESIPFGIAVTLEVLDDININIYNEIRNGIMTQVKVGAA